jgi:hypothetical protein
LSATWDIVDRKNPRASRGRWAKNPRAKIKLLSLKQPLPLRQPKARSVCSVGKWDTLSEPVS